MQVQLQHTKSLLLFFLFTVVLSTTLTQAQDFYWIGGPGNWDDVAHWSKYSANQNAGPVGVLPDNNSIVIIDEFSGLTIGTTLTIPPGAYAVQDLIVTTPDEFTLLFDGTSGNEVEMSVYGDLTLTSTMNLSYNSTASWFHNQWKFEGSGHHNIATGNKNMNSVEFVDQAGIYTQQSNLRANGRIRMYGGTWNSGGFNVVSGILLFRDNQSSNSQLTKVFNTNGSNINVGEWDSGSTYGSLTVNGSHTIYTPRFRGSPKQINGPNFHYDKIVLLEYSDANSSGPIIEHNNFECRKCEIETIIIEDTGETKFADQFTVNQTFEVTNNGSTILFNGGNSRTSIVTFNGTIITPSVSGCTGRTIFRAVHTNNSTFERASGTLTIEDAIIEDIIATGGATFNVSNGVLVGSSTGWTIANAPTGITYVWEGITGGHGNWTNPAMWKLIGGSSNGCIPTVSDNVVIDGDAKGGLRIPSSFIAECNDFTWTNQKGYELLLDGTLTQSSTLVVHGDFYMDGPTTVTGVDNHEIIFSSSGNNSIEIDNISLPEVKFVGAFGSWDLNSRFICNRLTFESGTLNTNDRRIDVTNWYSIGTEPKVYNLFRSDIFINEKFTMSNFTYGSVTVNAGASFIRCKDINYDNNLVLHDLKLTNTTAITLSNFPLTLNRLILGGSGEVKTLKQLNVNTITFESNGASLSLNGNPLSGDVSQLIVNEGLSSLSESVNPAQLKSSIVGTRVKVEKPMGNICATGNISIQDIDAILTGVFNAPQGIDDGNNTGIDFSSPSGSGDFYWIAGSGNISEASNYSELSGGCPTNRDPSTSQKLIFDRNGIFTAGDVISVPNAEVFQQLVFKNSASVILSIENSLSVDDVIVDQGYINITGGEMEISNETKVKNNGFITTNLQDFTTDKLTTESGVLIVRAGSSATVKN